MNLFARLSTRLDLLLARRVARATLLAPQIFGDPSRVRVSQTAVVKGVFFNVVSGSITVEDYAFVAHGTLLLTGTHDISKRGIERQRAVPSEGRDIVVETGAWIASGAIVLGPCRIGRDAVVAAGAVVTRDVPPTTVVAGNPAAVIRPVPSDPQSN